ncbi:MAG: SRPBCC domain-containing protein [Chloroflexi bacterium]|nr:SRPBCC domain-containing protein [Chloroflexota bacterium]
MASPTEVLEAERPRYFRTRFGNRLLRGENATTFEPEGTGTRLTEVFRTEGLIPAIVARLFGMGSYKGSFRGELAEFGRIAEREPA